MADRPKLKKRVKYATSPDGKDEAEAAHRQRIGYHGGSLTQPGNVGPWRDSPDNPMAPGFVPLTDRSERAKARWWALRSRHPTRPTHGVYDA